VCITPSYAVSVTIDAPSGCLHVFIGCGCHFGKTTSSNVVLSILVCENEGSDMSMFRATGD
jgi:hypothetical protein